MNTKTATFACFEMNVIDLNKKGWQWALLIFLSIMWGSSFILMKRGLLVYSHTQVAAIRISLSFLVLVPFAFQALRKVEKKKWVYILISGVFGNGIPAFLFTKAQTQIPSALSGMLNSLTPIFALILGLLFFKARTGTLQIIGVIIGLAGAVGLITSNGVDLSNTNFSYSLYIVLATICYAISVNVIKTHLKEINAIHITALAFFSIGPVTIPYLFTTDFVDTFLQNEHALQALGYIAILAIFGTAMSVLLFNMLIKKTTTLFATSVTYLIPIVAILWGMLDGEKFNMIQAICIITTLIGIYFINKFR
ncbi:MAG: DMT family transporter [Flavobacteriales bacterium]|nr:DMT family transporter [Flavobacteriales bacterium]